MMKFILGVVLGAALAFGYVRWDVSLPGMLDIPGKLRGNLISSAAESHLYSLKHDAATRRRALEIFFANRAAFAVKVDAEFGHPFLEALYQRRARREARQLRMQWSAFDAAISRPALRAKLEQKHGTSDTGQLKRKMLAAALDRYAFLKSWMDRKLPPVTKDNLLEKLKQISSYRQDAGTPVGRPKG